MKRGLSVTIDLDSPEAVFRQVAAQIRGFIVDGGLGPGDELPSVRRLSIDLGVHFNTIAEAYRQLAEQGWVEVSHGRSARVVERGRSAAPPETVARLRERLRGLVSEMRAEGVAISRIRKELEAAIQTLNEGGSSK